MVYFTSLLLVLFVTLFGRGEAALLLPSPDMVTHSYKVAVAHLPLTDVLHKDPYAPDKDRRIMASIFMPIPTALCAYECQVTYMPPGTARIANEQFLSKAPDGVFEKIGYTACCSASDSIDASKYPVVVLEPNVDTSRLLYTNLARYMSANGVVVVLLDHPEDTSIVEFPRTTTTDPETVYNSGTITLSNFSPITEWNETVTRAIETRQQDIKYALERLQGIVPLQKQFPDITFTAPLNTSTYAIVGHGLGGSVATSLSFNDTRVRYSVNLAGTPPLLSTPSKATIYFLGRSNYKRDDDIHWPATWTHLTGRVAEFDLDNSDIFDFSDLPIILELARNEGKMLGVEGKAVHGSPVANHAIVYLVEAAIRKEDFGNPRALQDCVGVFGVVKPYPGH